MHSCLIVLSFVTTSRLSRRKKKCKADAGLTEISIESRGGGSVSEVLCQICGERNPAEYRFCGICGTPLTKPVPIAPPIAERPRSAVRPLAPEEREPDPLSAAATAAGHWEQVVAVNPPALPPPEFNTPPTETPTYLIEDTRTAHWRPLLILLVLAALGLAGWWGYVIYTRPDPSTAQQPPAPVVSDNTPSSEPAPEKTGDSPGTNANSSAPEAAPAKSAPVESAPPVKSAPKKTFAKPVKPTPPRSPVKAAAAPEADTSDALLRQGESALNGRGPKQDCDEAARLIKAAAAKGNPKAWTTLGTMYSTSHCVSRDLPAAYHWLALALHAEPDNHKLALDLTSIWNQMTPAERQLATRYKP